jgi:hypothetical protein
MRKRSKQKHHHPQTIQSLAHLSMTHPQRCTPCQIRATCSRGGLIHSTLFPPRSARYKFPHHHGRPLPTSTDPRQQPKHPSNPRKANPPSEAHRVRRRNGDGTSGFIMRRLLPRPPPRRRRRFRGRPRRRGQVVGAAAGVVGEGRLPGAGGGARAGAGRRRGRGRPEALRGRPDGGEGAGAARADGGHGVVPRRHVPLRHRLPPRPLRLALASIASPWI